MSIGVERSEVRIEHPAFSLDKSGHHDTSCQQRLEEFSQVERLPLRLREQPLTELLEAGSALLGLDMGWGRLKGGAYALFNLSSEKVAPLSQAGDYPA